MLDVAREPRGGLLTTHVPSRPGTPGPVLDAAVEAALVTARHELDSYLADRASEARRTDPLAGELWDVLAEQVGGKLVRPRLTLAAYLGLGGTDLDAVVPVAAAQEVLHTAMLVHDDLLDHDEVRRGRPNVAGTFRHRLAARGVVGHEADARVQAAALLAGDLALAGSVDVVLRSGLDARTKVHVASLLVGAVHTTVAGEILDVTGSSREPDRVDALRVAELKTARYTCVTPLVAGAGLAGASPDVVARLTEYGRAAGIAFQLVDDLIGTLGDPDVTGKSDLSDLREGKRTYLLALAHERADAAQRTVLDATVGRADLDEAGAAAARDVVRATGAVAATRAEAEVQLARACDAVADGVPAPLAQHLTELATTMGRRRS